MKDILILIGLMIINNKSNQRLEINNGGLKQGRRQGLGNLGDADRLLSGPNFLLAKLAVLKHLTTVEDNNKNVYIITGQLISTKACMCHMGDMTYYRPPFHIFFLGGGDV